MILSHLASFRLFNQNLFPSLSLDQLDSQSGIKGTVNVPKQTSQIVYKRLTSCFRVLVEG